MLLWECSSAGGGGEAPGGSGTRGIVRGLLCADPNQFGEEGGGGGNGHALPSPFTHTLRRLMAWLHLATEQVEETAGAPDTHKSVL